MPMAIGWVGGTALGYALPVTPRGPLAVAAAFLPLAFIVALLPTQWRGRPSVLPWTCSAVVAVGVATTLEHSWAMLIGGGVGTLLSVLQGDDA
jgi:predicted branched-subunit amino acid permease